MPGNVPAVRIRGVTAAPKFVRRHGNSYEIFILVLTLFSMLLIVLQLLPIDDDTRFLVTVYDDVICAIFLIDFTYNMIITRPRQSNRPWAEPGSI